MNLVQAWVLVMTSGMAYGDDITSCHSTPALLRHVAPFTDEYTQFVASSRRADSTNPQSPPQHPAGDPRRRRSTAIVVGQPPISTLDLSGLSDPLHLWVAGVAWKLMALLFRVADDEDRIAMSIVAVSGTIHTGDATILLGTAASDTRVITLYVDNIPNEDAMLVVLLHEMLHLMGYGTLSSPGAGSFYSRHNPITLEYNSAATASCVRNLQGYTGSEPIHTDPSGSHWNMSSPQFDDHDLMKPILSFGKTDIGICTTLAVLESRPRWTNSLCYTDRDCQLFAGTTCQRVGHHWISVCQTRRDPDPVKTIDDPDKVVFFLGTYTVTIAVFWIITLQCRHRSTKQGLQPGQEYPWTPRPTSAQYV